MVGPYETASAWHGGQWSAMYMFMCSGVVNRRHREDLELEIESCISKAVDDEEELANLQEFLQFVKEGDEE